MPKIHRKVELDRYSISVKPKGFFRELRPYFVGDTVEFSIKISGEPSGNGLYVSEVFGNDKYESIWHQSGSDFTKDWIHIVGNPIDSEGDIKYKFGFSAGSGKTLVSAKATNKDTWFPTLFWILVTAFLSMLATIFAQILFGVIKIDPTWVMKLMP